MKFLVLLALVSLASGYKQFIQVAGRNVITDDGRAGSARGGGGAGLGASASGGLGGASSGFGGSAGSLSFGAGAGGAGGASYGAGASLGGGRLSGGSKGLAGALSGVLSPSNAVRASGGYAGYGAGGDSASLLGSVRSKQVATPVINAAPAFPVIAEQQNVFSSGQQSSQFSSLAGGFGGFDSASASVVPQGGVVQAAVITKYRVQYVDVPSQGGEAQVQQIVIPAKRQPLEISFESASSPVKVNLVHIPGQAAAPQVSSHQEEPDLLKSEIIKPIIHEVIEAIQPIRKVTQEVRPVIETINQIISRGQSVQVAGATATGSVAGISSDSAATLGAKPISAQFGQGLVGSVAIAQPVQTEVAQVVEQQQVVSLPQPQIALPAPQAPLIQPRPQISLPKNFLPKNIPFNKPQLVIDLPKPMTKPTITLPQLSLPQPVAAIAQPVQQQISQELIEKKKAKKAA